MAFFTTICAIAAAYDPTAPIVAKASLRALFERSADKVYACPVTKGPLRSEVTVIGSRKREFKVSPEGQRYPVRKFVDLLESSARKSGVSLDELRDELVMAWSTRTQTQLFRSPITSWLYERGWRQNFRNAGFPGIEREYEEVADFFAPLAGGVVVDMSCGSGLMSRRLLSGEQFSRVLALDYSETMLLETRRRTKEAGLPLEKLELCRADVASLPLQTNSIDAMHAGAALHSWPRLELGLQEIARVLKPGGRFFATTFLQGAYGMRVPGTEAASSGGSFRFFGSEEELTALLEDAGFSRAGIQVRREGRGCAVVRAVLPVEAAAAHDMTATDAESIQADVSEDVAELSKNTEALAASETDVMQQTPIDA